MNLFRRWDEKKILCKEFSVKNSVFIIFFVYYFCFRIRVEFIYFFLKKENMKKNNN